MIARVRAALEVYHQVCDEKGIDRSSGTALPHLIAAAMIVEALEPDRVTQVAPDGQRDLASLVAIAREKLGGRAEGEMP